MHFLFFINFFANDQNDPGTIGIAGTTGIAGTIGITGTTRTAGTTGNLFFYLNFVCVGRVPDPTSHFLPTSFLYVNLVAMGSVTCHQSPGPKHYGIGIP